MSSVASALAAGRRFAEAHALKLRFAATGAVNTVVGLGTFPLLITAFSPYGLNYIGALLLSHVICVSFAFYTTKVFTFKTKGNIVREFSKYYPFNLCNLAINLVTLPFLVHILKFPVIPSQLGYGMVVMILSYFWHSRITFRPK
jgi:putative flippase GtrA